MLFPWNQMKSLIFKTGLAMHQTMQKMAFVFCGLLSLPWPTLPSHSDSQSPFARVPKTYAQKDETPMTPLAFGTLSSIRAVSLIEGWKDFSLVKKCVAPQGLGRQSRKESVSLGRKPLTVPVNARPLPILPPRRLLLGPPCFIGCSHSPCCSLALSIPLSFLHSGSFTLGP